MGKGREERKIEKIVCCYGEKWAREKEREDSKNDFYDEKEWK